jgi:hypothetical protein
VISSKWHADPIVHVNSVLGFMKIRHASVFKLQSEGNGTWSFSVHICLSFIIKLVRDRNRFQELALSSMVCFPPILLKFKELCAHGIISCRDIIFQDSGLRCQCFECVVLTLK